MMTKHIWTGLFSALFSFAVTAPFLNAADTGAALREPAPGVMTTVRPFINYSETFQWSDVPEIVAEASDDADSSYNWAKDLYFSKEIWCLQFSFKPVRFITVDFPNKEGKMDAKTVWYMVYSVTNTGKVIGAGVSSPADDKAHVMVRDTTLTPEEIKALDPKDTPPLKAEEVEQKANNLDGTYVVKEFDYQEGVSRLKEVKEGEKKDGIQTYNLETVEEEKIDLTPVDGKVPGTVRFSPQFILASSDLLGTLDYTKDETGYYTQNGYEREKRTWNDQYLPLAFVRIAALEDPNRMFQNSISFPAVDIAPGETYWGIATWTDVDPRVNNFTIYVSGLTNALRWTDDPDKAYNKENQLPMIGRSIYRKVLKLNFFRPGDQNITPDTKVYFGIPENNGSSVPGKKGSEWVYM